jgi:hypothetical protein
VKATELGANPEEKEMVAEQQEVPKKATVKTDGALKNRHEDRHLAIGCHQKPKKQTQDNGGSRKKLAAACRRMTRCAILAWSKGQGKDNKALPRTQKGHTFRKRYRAKLEGISGIRFQVLKK